MTTKTRVGAAGTITALRRILAENAKRGRMKLQVKNNDFVEEGGWLNIIVTPVDPDVRAMDYVDELVSLEKKLKTRVGRKRVILVPAIA